MSRTTLLPVTESCHAAAVQMATALKSMALKKQLIWKAMVSLVFLRPLYFPDEAPFLTYPCEGVYDDQCTADKQAARKTLRHGGSGGIPVSDHPRLPSEPNEVQCLSDPNSPTSSMISDIDACHNAIYSLGTDMSRQICSSDCSDGGNGQNSVWCRVAWDESKDCALTIAARSPERGGPGYACVSLGDAMNFWNIAQAVPEDGGKGCHPVGTRDFAATFLEPGGSWRLCLSDFGTADYCTL